MKMRIRLAAAAAAVLAAGTASGQPDDIDDTDDTGAPVGEGSDPVGEEAEDLGEAVVDVGQETGELAGAIYEGARETWFEPELALFVGGGAESFVSRTSGDVAGAGGTWDLRAVLGTRSRVALEGAYIGSAADLDSQLGNDSATLLGTTFEVVGRVHIIPDAPLKPYGFLGLGWRHYEVVGADFTMSSEGLADSDDLITLPLGVGLSYRFTAFGLPLVADARAAFRPNLGADLIVQDPVDPGDDDFAAMHTWDLNARLGYEL